MPDLSIQEIVPGVNVALGGVCNRGIINQGRSVLVVDAGIAVAEATPLRATAQERRKEGALYLFNTHPHGDHVYGNQVFADSPIIAHEGVRHDLVNHGQQTLANWRQNSRMQDHRFIKRLVKPGMGFFSLETAGRTLPGYEVMNMLRKGQVSGVGKGDITGQVTFVARLFGVAA